MSPPVRLERRGAVVELTIDRPPLNILDLETIAALSQAVAEVAAQADREAAGEPGLRLVVLRGAGRRAFSAGVSVADHTPEKVEAMLAGFHAAVLALRALAPPTLAVVSGHCLGGGMELAAGCDLVLASDDARFGQPEIELGCYPPLAAALYPALLGPGRTLELLLTGRVLDAAEAERLGFVTWRAAPERLDDRLAEIVALLTGKSGPVCRLIKRAVAAGRDLPFPRALAESERLYREELCRTADMTEGLTAFLEKRQPVWRHH